MEPPGPAPTTMTSASRHRFAHGTSSSGRARESLHKRPACSLEPPWTLRWLGVPNLCALVAVIALSRSSTGGYPQIRSGSGRSARWARSSMRRGLDLTGGRAADGPASSAIAPGRMVGRSDRARDARRTSRGVLSRALFGAEIAILPSMTRRRQWDSGGPTAQDRLTARCRATTAAGQVAPGDLRPAGRGDPARQRRAGPARPGSTRPGRRTRRGCSTPRRATGGQGAHQVAAGRPCGTARSTGWLNSHTTSRPPGRVDPGHLAQRRVGVDDVAQPERDGRPRRRRRRRTAARSASPASSGTVRPASPADREHAEREVDADRVRAGPGQLGGGDAGAGREVEHPLARAQVERLRG